MKKFFFLSAILELIIFFISGKDIYFYIFIINFIYLIYIFINVCCLIRNILKRLDVIFIFNSKRSIYYFNQDLFIKKFYNSNSLKLNNIKKVKNLYDLLNFKFLEKIENIINELNCQKTNTCIFYFNGIENAFELNRYKNFFYLRFLGAIYSKNNDYLIYSGKNKKIEFPEKFQNIIKNIDDSNNDMIYVKLDDLNNIFIKVRDDRYNICFYKEKFHSFAIKEIWNIYFKESNLAYFLIDFEKKILFKNDIIIDSGIKNINNENLTIYDLIHKEYYGLIDDSINVLENYDVRKKVIQVNLDNDVDSIVILNLQKITDDFILCYIVDITEQRNLELQFVHSQKMQAVGELSGGIAHDFNNILTAIIGFTEVLLTKHFPGDGCFSHVMNIKQSANKAANLVKQLLAFSRQQVLKPKILNPFDIINEVSFLIKRLIGKNIKLDLNGNYSVSNIKFDQGQLEQIIINIVINARDAILDSNNNESGIIIIDIRDEQITKNNNPKTKLFSPIYDEEMNDGDYVLITIEDNGIGIANDNLVKIFNPFFSTKDSMGTGLGLSTVYGIIKQENSYMFVDTKEGLGTKFLLYIPVCNDEFQNSFSKDDEKESVNINTEIGVNEDNSILIIEDDDSIRYLIFSILENRGYKIFSASCADDVMDFFENKNEKVDLIISDVIIPGGNGPSIIKNIKDRYLKNTKVIFISGYSKQYLDNEFIDDENVFFVEKPFAMKDLIKIIQNCMNKK